MPDFTKEEMLDELRTIFLFEADHILLGHGPELAEAFIGFPANSDSDEYVSNEPTKAEIARVDLSRFAIAGSFERGFDFAFAPSLTGAFGEHEVQDLLVFMEGTPRAGGIASGALRHRFMSPAGLCRTVADAAFARWKLEWERNGTFSTRELALLANMTEGAVRNALSQKGEAGLAAIPRSKPVAVEFEEALRWLKGRRGFRPTPERPAEDPVLQARINDIADAGALGRCVRLLAHGQGNLQQLADRLGWSEWELDAWIAGSFTFDRHKAAELAEALDLDLPLFVGKALEVSLRRDALG